MKFSFLSFGFRSRNKVEYTSNEKIGIKMVSQSVCMHLTTEDVRNLETTGERTRSIGNINDKVKSEIVLCRFREMV